MWNVLARGHAMKITGDALIEITGTDLCGPL